MNRRQRLLAMIVVVALLPLAPAGAYGEPSPKPDTTTTDIVISDPVPAGFHSWGELFSVQGRMNSALDAINAIADRLPDSGYAGSSAAPEDGVAKLYWRGPVPAVIAEAVQTQSKNIPIVVFPARYSLSELLQARNILGQHADVIQVGPAYDGSRLLVKTKTGRSASFRAALASVEGVSALGVTVDVEVIGEMGNPIPFTRQNDSPAYYAGARTQVCTTGFGINHGGFFRILFAAHCGVSGTVFDGGGDAIGTITNRNTTRDTSIIAGPGGARMWDGPWNEASFTKAVRGASLSRFGNWLCTSGSYSGIRCNIRVWIENTQRGSTVPVVVARHQAFGNAAGQGDSGGPVMEIPNPNDGKVIAKGIILGGTPGTEVTCTGLGNRICTWEMHYADVTLTLAFYGATILTS